jgi:RNA polymerase sigma factor (TIGR02999 family)
MMQAEPSSEDISSADSSSGTPARRPDPAGGELAALIYSELRALAGALMRSQSPDHTLQPTALVNEAYLRLARSCPEALRSRPHFLAVAAKAMRHVLINHAVAKKTVKRGGGATRVPLEAVSPAGPEVDQLEVLAVNEALGRLEQIDPRRASVVEARVFGGLTNAEIAEVLGISVTTVESDWRTARAWLVAEMRAGRDDFDGGSGSMPR